MPVIHAKRNFMSIYLLTGSRPGLFFVSCSALSTAHDPCRALTTNEPGMAGQDAVIASSRRNDPRERAQGERSEQLV